MIELEFDFTTPGWNTIKRWPGYKKRKLREKIQKEVLDELWKMDKIPRFTELVRIEYRRRSRVAMDQDNVATSAKYWLDAFTKYGLIKDDKPVVEGGHVEFVAVPEKGKKRTKITIQRMKKAPTS